ncbi:MAG: aldolase [Clostridia bacterium]|nr:aldolase [Clostridia bacterium]
MSLKLMYITNNLEVAMIAQKYGVDRIWIDLETLGKEERQKGQDSVKSHHSVNDIRTIKPYLNESEMLVRINPWHNESPEEINDVIDAGADIMMLPYWKSSKEVACFVNAVEKRCKTTLLLETKEAVECIDEVLNMLEVDEIHIGLNDLCLSYGGAFMFEFLANGLVDTLCRKFAYKGIPYGFGGIARLGCGDISAEKIIVEHYRLGSTRAILSRSFCNTDRIESIEAVETVFSQELKRLREYEEIVATYSENKYLSNHKEVVEIVERISKERLGV